MNVTMDVMQVKYVVELARALAKHPAVYRVDLLTRLIKDPAVDASYGEPVECILPSEGKLGGAYIVRLPCGDPNVYLRCPPRPVSLSREHPTSTLKVITTFSQRKHSHLESFISLSSSLSSH